MTTDIFGNRAEQARGLARMARTVTLDDGAVDRRDTPALYHTAVWWYPTAYIDVPRSMRVRPYD